MIYNQVGNSKLTDIKRVFQQTNDHDRQLSIIFAFDEQFHSQLFMTDFLFLTNEIIFSKTIQKSSTNRSLQQYNYSHIQPVTIFEKVVFQVFLIFSTNFQLIYRVNLKKNCHIVQTYVRETRRLSQPRSQPGPFTQYVIQVVEEVRRNCTINTFRNFFPYISTYVQGDVGFQNSSFLFTYFSAS